jgi:hypothetical protein
MRWIGGMLLHAHNDGTGTFLVYQYNIAQLWGRVSKVCCHWQHPMNGYCCFSWFGRCCNFGVLYRILEC